MQKGFGGGTPMEVRKAGEGDAAGGEGTAAAGRNTKQKPPFRPAKDDTKPLLRDPILRSDPIETEQAVLRLPPFPRTNSQF
ncbi:uncharacterized protein [Elaeis guineensis]|uniref:Uncharacterized protein LOC109505637 n=1 Tax=Elaeis guineensis var. tenera TaxID=51953 RepID=A0A6J0PHW2_ELAGV|nr:uncharacterized protein LOC109505637 [Elaeis guineensis]